MYNLTFRDIQSVNRGFGGSTLPDVIPVCQRYYLSISTERKLLSIAVKMILRQMIIQPHKVVFDRFKTLYGMIREKLKTVQVAYISSQAQPKPEKVLAEK
jgi:hypothetical protein